MKSNKEWIKFTNYEKSFTNEIVTYCKANKVEYTLQEFDDKDVFNFNLNPYELEKLKNFIDFCPRMG